MAQYRLYLEKHYRQADGSATSEVDSIRQAMRPLTVLYTTTEANRLALRCLKGVRQQMSWQLVRRGPCTLWQRQQCW